MHRVSPCFRYSGLLRRSEHAKIPRHKHQDQEVGTVDLEEAARITGVDSLDITWALENEGVCEIERYTITEIFVGNELCQ